jgi:hypothetical protein
MDRLVPLKALPGCLDRPRLQCTSVVCQYSCGLSYCLAQLGIHLLITPLPLRSHAKSRDNTLGSRQQEETLHACSHCVTQLWSLLTSTVTCIPGSCMTHVWCSHRGTVVHMQHSSVL